MIVSFAWTTPALLAGAKTVTRRDWSPSHAAKFHAGMLVDAWDASPRTGRSRKVATIRLTRDPYLELTSDAPLEHYEREGFVWLDKHGLGDLVAHTWREWRTKPQRLYVVEFALVEVVRR